MDLGVYVAIICIALGVLLLYIIVGETTIDLIEGVYYDYFKNPIWRLPLFVFWPVGLFIILGADLYIRFKEYLKEVKDYYSDKKENKNE